MRKLTRITTIATMSFFKILTTVMPLANFMIFTLCVMDMVLMANMCLHLSKKTIQRFSLKYYRTSFISTQKLKWVLEFPVPSRRRSKFITCATIMKKMTMVRYRDLSLASIEIVALFQDKVL